MTIEKLLQEQYELLGDVADGYIPDPKNSLAIVAKDGESIVGRVLLVAIPHVEGTWIKESHRSGTLGARLYRALERESKALGLTQLGAFCEPEHDSYMERLGYKRIPVSVWRKDL